MKTYQADKSTAAHDQERRRNAEEKKKERKKAEEFGRNKLRLRRLFGLVIDDRK